MFVKNMCFNIHKLNGVKVSKISAGSDKSLNFHFSFEDIAVPMTRVTFGKRFESEVQKYII